MVPFHFEPKYNSPNCPGLPIQQERNCAVTTHDLISADTECHAFGKHNTACSAPRSGHAVASQEVFSGGHQAQPPVRNIASFQPDQAAQSFLQPNTDHFQGQDIYSFSRQPIPVLIHTWWILFLNTTSISLNALVTTASGTFITYLSTSVCGHWLGRWISGHVSVHVNICCAYLGDCDEVWPKENTFNSFNSE